MVMGTPNKFHPFNKINQTMLTPIRRVGLSKKRNMDNSITRVNRSCNCIVESTCLTSNSIQPNKDISTKISTKKNTQINKPADGNNKCHSSKSKNISKSDSNAKHNKEVPQGSIKSIKDKRRKCNNLYSNGKINSVVQQSIDEKLDEVICDKTIYDTKTLEIDSIPRMIERPSIDSNTKTSFKRIRINYLENDEKVDGYKSKSHQAVTNLTNKIPCENRILKVVLYKENLELLRDTMELAKKRPQNTKTNEIRKEQENNGSSTGNITKETIKTSQRTHESAPTESNENIITMKSRDIIVENNTNLKPEIKTFVPSFINTNARKQVLRRSLSLKKNDSDISNSQIENVVINIDAIGELETEVQKNESLLQSLKLAENCKRKHNTTELKQITERWKTGCIQALYDLFPQIQKYAPMEMCDMLKNIGVPSHLVNWDPENELLY